MGDSLGTAPIPGDAPAGASVRYEPEFEQLEAEIGKLESVEQTPVDWRVVEELCRSLLGTKGKDLLVSSYLTVACLERRGYAGLHEGLQIVWDMCQTYWEDLQPKKKRKRARGNAIDWLKERALARVEGIEQEPTEVDREALSGSVALVKELYGFCMDELGDDAPALGPLRRELQKRVDLIPEPQAEPAPAPEPPPAEAAPAPAPAAAAAPAPAAAAAPPPPPPAPAAPVAAPSAPSAPSGADLSSVYKTLDSSWDALLQCADIIFQSEPHNPDSYALRRFATWNKSKFSEVRQPEGGKLSFPGNKPGLLEKLDEQLANEEWQAVLQAAEPECSQRPFWVDPHYYVFRALEGLGKRYAAAAAAVEGQARAFAASHPAALELRFSNDAPLASGPTKLWLSSGGGGGEGGEGAGGVEGKLLAALGEARQQVLSGELGPAVQTVRGALNGARGRRADFLLGLTLARLCLDGGRAELARSQLDRLAGDCERYQLADWEPELAVQLLELRWRSLKDSPAEGEDPDALYSRLAALDLSAALALTDA